jgi:hypothetical protein
VGTILTALENVSTSEPLLKTALAKRKELFGANHLSVAESQHSLALCLLKQRRVEEAKTLLTDELQARINVLGADSPIIAKTQAEMNRLLGS